MGENSKIEWCDSTFNPVIGCQKVSAGCDNCFAEALARRYRWADWGPRAARRRTSAANWRKPLAWNRAAEASGKRHRVFCASLCDVFDNQWPPEWRADLWALIRQCKALDWQLLTKRPQNIAAMLPSDWGDGWRHVWLGTTTEDQRTFDQRWPVLARVPAAVRFLSYEPAIGPLTLSGCAISVDRRYPDWIITGGESGPGARVMEPQWAADVLREARLRMIPVFHKQWGSWPSNPLVRAGMSAAEAERRDPKSNGKGGALLNGRLWRQFPRSAAA